MKIQYQVDDEVYKSSNYGGVRYTVVDIHTNGVTVENVYGERAFLGFRQIEPCPGTVGEALIIREDPTLKIPKQMTPEMVDVYEEYHGLGYNPMNDHFRANHFWEKFRPLITKE